MTAYDKPADVLIVDSSMAWRNAIAQTLRHKFSGISIREAGNGEQALQMALTPPDLVITELFLPGLSGWDLLKRLQALETTRDTPVIVMSEKMDMISVLQLVRSGATAILVKPFGIEEMLQRAESLLSHKTDGGGTKPSIKPQPRSAVRRLIRETIYIRIPVKLLTPEDICFAAPKSVLSDALVECDFGEVNRMLGMPLPDAPVSCQILGRSVIGGIDVVRLRPQERIEKLAQAIEEQFRKMGAQTTVLALGELTPMIGIPARTADISALGMRIFAPLEFEISDEITLSVQRLLRHLFSRSVSYKILAKVARCQKTSGGFEIGLRFSQTPPQLLSDILQWTAVGQT
ncbi:MAG: response regulator [Candidatus Sumerlaeota bacterium]|nr:response regulator [Candidatus Sumerlaeota bacterium]